jgi:hypothetical protein
LGPIRSLRGQNPFSQISTVNSSGATQSLTNFYDKLDVPKKSGANQSS